ncbi:MAG: site-2 protease family protein [Thermoplasmata archaeon]
MLVENAMVPPIPPEASKEIEFVRSLVAKHFPVYDVRVSYDVVQFFCRVDSATLETSFEQMREDMAANGYIPMISYDKGEHIVTVARRPERKYRSVYVNLVFLGATFVTTLIAGAMQWAAYNDVPGDDMFSPNNLLAGMIVFTLPLMGMLGFHEMGHYLVARKRKVAASMPFFIPMVPPFGTLGAAIALRDPIPNRKTLLEIGVAGPLAGMLLAVPLAVVGVILTNSEAKEAPVNIGDNVIGIWLPLLYRWIYQLLPAQGDYLFHPTALAAWVGLFVTGLNLLPVGQLDGGHIARALLGSRAKYLGWATVAVLLAFSMLYWGWLFLVLLVLFLGVNHPPPLNDISKLDIRRKGVGLLAFAVLMIAFVPVPFFPIAQDHAFEMTPIGTTNATMVPGGSVEFSMLVNNTGNTLNTIDFYKGSSPSGWTVEFKRAEQNDSFYSQDYNVSLNSSETAVVDILVGSPPFAQAIEQNVSVEIKGAARDSSVTRSMVLNFTIARTSITYWVINDGLQIPRGEEGALMVQLNNTGPAPLNLELETRDVPGYVGAVLFIEDPYDPAATSQLNITVPGEYGMVFGALVFVSANAPLGEKVVHIDVLYTGVLIATVDVTIVVY